MDKVLGTTTIRPKGEITIPSQVRKYLGLKPGDKISLTWEKGKVIVRKVKTIHEDFTLDE